MNISHVRMVQQEIGTDDDPTYHRPPEEPEDFDPLILDQIDPRP